jgi:hypothetical protein
MPTALAIAVRSPYAVDLELGKHLEDVEGSRPTESVGS